MHRAGLYTIESGNQMQYFMWFTFCDIPKNTFFPPCRIYHASFSLFLSILKTVGIVLPGICPVFKQVPFCLAEEQWRKQSISGLLINVQAYAVLTGTHIGVGPQHKQVLYLEKKEKGEEEVFFFFPPLFQYRRLNAEEKYRKIYFYHIKARGQKLNFNSKTASSSYPTQIAFTSPSQV